LWHQFMGTIWALFTKSPLEGTYSKLNNWPHPLEQNI
jgi:hypothetical protein